MEKNHLFNFDYHNLLFEQLLLELSIYFRMESSREPRVIRLPSFSRVVEGFSKTMRISYTFLREKMKESHKNANVIALVLFRTLFGSAYDDILKKRSEEDRISFYKNNIWKNSYD